MSSATLDQARAELDARQGGGARRDAAGAPAEILDWARLGTAYFARLLNGLADSELDASVPIVGWTRRHVVAQVGYHARALALTVAGTGSGTSFLKADSGAVRASEIKSGSTLPAHALRALFRHSAVHLDVEWRDLDAGPWECTPRDLGILSSDVLVGVRDTPWLRARELWLRSLDLDVGGSLADAPPAFVDRLIANTVRAWPDQHPPIEPRPTDRSCKAASPRTDMIEVSGTAADLARWLTGRGARRLTHASPLPAVPAPTRRTS